VHKEVQKRELHLKRTKHDIVLFTSLQKPFYLANPIFTSNSRPDLTLSAIVLSTAPLESGEFCNINHQYCEQEWDYSFSAAESPPVCDFTGNWTITFNVFCFSGSPCPLPIGSIYNASVFFSLTTEDFCPQLFPDISASATLNSFQDSQHLIPETDFILGAPIYFMTSVSSSQATIVNSKVLCISNVQTSTTLYSNGGSLIGSNLVVIDPPDTAAVTESYFKIITSQAYFPVATDQSSAFDIEVIIELTFADTEGSQSTRPQILIVRPNILLSSQEYDVSSTPADVSMSISVAGKSVTSDTGSATAMCFQSNVVLVVSAIFFALVCL